MSNFTLKTIILTRTITKTRVWSSIFYLIMITIFITTTGFMSVVDDNSIDTITNKNNTVNPNTFDSYNEDAGCNLNVSLGDDFETCSDSVTLTANVSGASTCESCTGEYTVEDTENCNGRYSYVMWLTDREDNGNNVKLFSNVDLEFIELNNGTATLKGTIADLEDSQSTYDVDVVFRDKRTSPPADSPKENRCNDEDDSDWIYYKEFEGTVTSTDGSWSMDVTRNGPSFQLGKGANMTEKKGGTLGACGWFNSSDSVYVKGDFNFNLGDCIKTSTKEVSYLWSTGETTPSITVNQSGRYKVTVEDCEDCSSSDRVRVTFKDGPSVDAGEDQTICAGEEVTLTAAISGNESCDDCTEYDLKNTDHCNRDENYVMWLTGNRHFSNVDLEWNELPNGTATLKGTVFDYTLTQENYELDIVFSGKTVNTPSNSPKDHWCNDEDESGWTYYTQFTGSLVSTDGSWSADITKKGPAFQMGNGANNTEKERGKYGASGWFTLTDPVFCDGDFNFNFGNCTASGTDNTSYLWSTGETTQSIVVSPQQNTNYSVSVSSCEGCDVSDSVNVVVDSAAADAGSDQDICLGESATLTVSGSGDVVWSTGETTASITVSPTEDTEYSVTVTDGNCEATDSVMVNVGAATADAGSDQDICLGDSATLTATGAGDIAWSTGETTASINVSPTENTEYSVTITNGDCEATDSVMVNVGSATADAGEDQEICLGESTTLSVAGSGDVLWSTGETTASITVSPTEDTEYSVTVTNGDCTATDMVLVRVNITTANARNDRRICLGESVNLRVIYDAGDILWSTGETTRRITVSPTEDTEYTVTITNGDCTASDSVMVFVNTVEIDAGVDQNICLGETATLSVAGSGDVLWSTGETTQSITVSPIEDTEYSVTVTKRNCTATDSVLVQVGSATADAGDDQEICLGESTTLSVSGSGDVLWSTGETTQSITISPTTETEYSVTVTDGDCTATDNVTVTVNPLAVDAGVDQNICLGETTTLSVIGSGDVVWSTGETTPSITVSPTAETEYSVTITNGNCSETDTVVVKVIEVTADVGPNQHVCLGESLTLNVSGSGDVLWSTGETTQSITVSPIEDTYYSVTISNGDCKATDSLIVRVDEATVDAGLDQQICLGESVVLTATSSEDVIWSTGETTPSITVSPTEDTEYSVSVTNCDCEATDSVIVSINPITADAGLDQDICLGESTILTVSGAADVVWSTGETTPSITVSPTEDTEYSVTITDGDCTATDSVIVNVITVTADVGPNQHVCLGESLTLTVSGSGDVLWSTGETTQSITVSPIEDIQYSVTISNGDCIATDSLIVRVDEASVDAGIDQDICLGESVILTARSVEDVLWSTGETTPSITVSPTEDTEYSVKVINCDCEATDAVLVQVGSATADAGLDQDICLGGSTILTVSGSGDVLWSTGETTRSITVSPDLDTEYNVVVTNGDCTATDSVNVRVGSATADAGADQDICIGESTTLTALGIGNDVIWSTGETSQSILVSPTEDTEYMVTLTNGDCQATDTVIVRVNSAAADAGIDQDICLGEATTLTVSGSGNVLWSTGETTQSISVSPNQTTSYNVTVTDGDCTATDSVTVNVGTATVDAGVDQDICIGESATLSIIGDGDVVWSTGETTRSITVSPDSDTDYNVVLTNGGCTATDSVTVRVNSAIADAGVDQDICLGDSATLTVIGNGDVVWSTGDTAQSILVSPTEDTEYTVTATNGDCETTDTIIVRVNSATADAGIDQTITVGESILLTVIGEGTYLWSTGDNTSSITVSPDQTSTYSVTVSNNGCEAIDEVTVFVEDCSVFLDLGEDQTLCLGEEDDDDENEGERISTRVQETIAFSAPDADSYLWSTGETTQSIVVSPSADTEYSLTITTGSCTATDSVIVRVILATVNAGVDQDICLGDSTTLTASSSGDVIWSTGATTSSITVSPSQTTIYSVTVNDGGCSASDSVVVRVNSATADAGIDQDICLGDSTTLTASGLGDVVWSTGETSRSISVSPSQTTEYNVTVTDGDCAATDSVIVNVGSATADVGVDQDICLGDSTTLTVVGSGDIVWSTGETSQSISVSPSETTTYTATVSNGNCEASDSVTVNVGSATADVGIDQDICLGDSTTLTVVGSGDIVWSTGETSQSISVSPSQTTTYTATVSNGNCEAIDSVTVNVGSATADAGVDQDICLGDSTTLTVVGSGDIVWSTGETSQSISVSPSQTTTYSVTVMNGNCEATDSVTVNVGSATADAGIDQDICLGDSTTLTVVGSGDIVWSTGETSQSISVSPSQTTTYTATVSNGNCEATDSVIVSVRSVTADAGIDQDICLGDSTVLIVSGSGNVVWSTGATTRSIRVSPSQTTTYTATVSNGGCSATDSIVVTVGSATADAGTDQTITLGDSAILNASGEGTYLWSTGETSSSIFVTPNDTTTYSVKVTNGGCDATDEVTVFVEDCTIFLDLGDDRTLCLEEEDDNDDEEENRISTRLQETVALTGPTADSYLWSTGETTQSIVVFPPVTTVYTLTITVGGCTETDEVTVFVETCIFNIESTIYPTVLNAGDRISIDFVSEKEQEVSVSFYNVTGTNVIPVEKKAIKKGNTSLFFNMNSSMTSGVYLVEIITENGNEFKKFVIE